MGGWRYYLYATVCTVLLLGAVLTVIVFGSADPTPIMQGGSAYPKGDYVFTEEEKEQIIEYMKGLGGDAEHSDTQAEKAASEAGTGDGAGGSEAGTDGSCAEE